MTYKYGVQWVDDGGVFEHYTVIEDMECVFEKMGLPVKIIDDGGVTLKNEELHYYILTDIEIPHWDMREFVSDVPHRYSDSADLWLYTFEIKEDMVQTYHTHDEYIEMVDW